MKRHLAAAAAVPLVSAAISVAVIPEPQPATAAAYGCRRWVDPDDRDWGYLFCTKGKSTYWAEIKCVVWIGDVPQVYWAVGNFAHPNVQASVGWCPDGYRIRRIVKMVVPT